MSGALCFAKYTNVATATARVVAMWCVVNGESTSGPWRKMRSIPSPIRSTVAQMPTSRQARWGIARIKAAAAERGKVARATVRWSVVPGPKETSAFADERLRGFIRAHDDGTTNASAVAFGRSIPMPHVKSFQAAHVLVRIDLQFDDNFRSDRARHRRLV